MQYIEEPVKKIRGLANFDILGAMLLDFFLGALVLVLDQGQSWGWGDIKFITSYLVSGISFILFLFVESKAKEPVVDLKFFMIPVFTTAIINSFISFMGLMGGIFLIPVFAQIFLGYTVTKAGYIFILMAMGIMISAQLGARLTKRIKPAYVISFGMSLAALGMFLFSGIDIKWTFWDIALRLFVMAFGVGLGLSPLTFAATSTIPPQEIGVASSILALVRNIAGAFGTAIFATILTNATTSNLIKIGQFSVLNSTNPLVIAQYKALAAYKGQISAYSTVFHVTVFVMVLGAISALFITSKPTGVTSGQHSSEPIEI